jgi:hypothetical protein
MVLGEPYEECKHHKDPVHANQASGFANLHPSGAGGPEMVLEEPYEEIKHH